MNTRPISEDDLNGFVDGTLDAKRRGELTAYLEAHPDVADRIAGYRQQRDMLRATFGPVAEEPLPSRLDLRRMIDAHRRPGPASWRAMAAAAVVLLGVGGAGGWLMRGMPDVPAGGIVALAQEAAQSYAVYAPDRIRPVELRASNHGELVAWVSQRLGRSVAVPDLGASGYRFMGGRVVATAHGPAALFMYDDDHGTRLVLLTRPMASDRDAAMAPHTRGDVNGYAWADNGLGYSLVGQAAPQALRPIANEMREQIVTKRASAVKITKSPA
ncbi:anti-sigma factor [Xanthobacteraceae bacterium Astr-EGSB]|nr:anti-sigma factor [Xanthobacteraceae bacterium Astr-EGSB]